MDPIIATILICGIIAFAIGIFFDKYRISSNGTHMLITRKQMLEQKKITVSNEDWDTEYLRTEAAKHYILRIVPMKYWYLRDKKKTYDGMRWHCNCGATDYSMTLKMAEFNFGQHKTKKHEEALAQLGRFK